MMASFAVARLGLTKATMSTMASSSASTVAVTAASSSPPPLWLQRMKSVPIRYPMAFGIVLSGFKTSFSDLLVQKVVEQKEKVDWKRNAAFASFGFVYLGGVQYMLYVPIFGRLFPNAAKFAAKPLAQKAKDVRGMLQLVGQTFLDQCVHHPLMYFPAFYITKELVMAKDGRPDIQRVLSDYRTNMKEDLVALWKIWVPSMLFNFAFMPMHLRIPFVAGVSLLWTMVLSAMRGGDVVHGEEMAGGVINRSTYHILLEGLDAFNTTPVEMDAIDMDHFSISAAGKQRPGLVALLARHLADHGANVTHSKMVRLGQEFVIQMHVAIPKDRSKEFMRSLKYSKPLRQELDIQATPLTQRVCPKAKAVIGLRIHAVGDDRPGILADVAERIASRGMSLEDVTTSRRMSKEGRREFVIDALASSPNLADKENLDGCIAEISSLQQDLHLTHFDVRVHMEKM